jgi:hypothetical protein
VQDYILAGEPDELIASGYHDPEIPYWSLANFIATTGRDQCYTNVPYTSEIKKRQSPIPYFAFAEYKRQRDPNGDPAGQALAAMLVGQTMNANQHPVYGAFVAGRDWYFMVLDGKHYAISRGHNALQSEELVDILRVLKALKAIVVNLTT